jgi:two-component system nitrate/nitrite response regulator NarL
MGLKVSVLLGSDLALLCDRLAKSFKSTPDLYIVGIASNELEVRRLVKVCRPSVAILNLNIHPAALCDLVSALAAQKVSPLVVSDAIRETQAVELLQHGLNGIVPSTITSEMLCKSVRAIALGQIWISSQTITALVDHLRIPPAESGNSSAVLTEGEIITSRISPPGGYATNHLQNRFNLTRRELQIVRVLTEGMTNKEIAAAFGISEFTVKHHLAKIFDKLGVYSRLELATFATHHGVGKDVNPESATSALATC